jgi:FkbM family methyltransferase
MIRKLFFLRHLTRSLGINKLIFKLVYSRKKYEQYFDDLFSSKILPNYIVYDIGANVGYYSIIYSNIIGNGGKVYSFEPSLINFQKLTHNTHQNSNIFPLNFAIGETESNIFLSQGEDEIGANSRLSISASENGNWTQLRTLNSFTNELDFPNAIKIDVEGFEIDVLKGADIILKSKSLKVIGIELHSEILNENGVKFPENIIENILTNNGFKYKWVDFSHIVAFR